MAEIIGEEDTETIIVMVMEAMAQIAIIITTITHIVTMEMTMMTTIQVATIQTIMCQAMILITKDILAVRMLRAMEEAQPIQASWSAL